MKKCLNVLLIIILLINIVIIIYTVPNQSSASTIDTPLSSSNASFIGETMGDISAHCVANAGDVNGDGYDDFLIGAPWNNDGISGGGKAYLIFGNNTGWKMDFNLSQANASFIGTSYKEYLGWKVTGGGDINNDGYDDFLIGAYRNNEVGTEAGKVYLIFGRNSGWMNNTPINSISNASFRGENATDQAGIGISCSGDVNGDGFDDILIGACTNDQAGTEAGKIYLILGKSSNWSLNTSLLNADASFLGEKASNKAGFSLSISGDVNGDGFDDILIGAPDNKEGGMMPNYPYDGAGQIYLYFGKKNGWSNNVSLINSDASFIGEYAGDHAGVSVSIARDLNNNGFDDILIGSHMNDSAGINSGKAYLIFGNSSGWKMDINLSQVNTSFIGESKGDLAGNSISGVGDTNGDGINDFLVSAIANSENGFASGQTYLFLGKKSGWINNSNLSTADASFWGEYISDGAGYIVAGGGDYNGDGFDDILIGAESNDEGGKSAGQTYLIFPDQNSRPLTISTLKLYEDSTYVTETFQVKNGHYVYIELTGADGNSTQKNVAEVIVNSTSTDVKGFKVRLYETGLNTGIFRGKIRVNWISHESHKWIGAKKGEIVNVSSYKNPTKYDTVIVLNGDPQINPIQDNQNAIEDNFYNETYNFSDPDSDPVSWQFNSNATWLNWGSSNHTLYGTPTNNDVGSYWVNINISDGDGGFDEHNFSLKVENIPPKIITSDLISAVEDSQYYNDYNSSDDNQGTISWSLITNSTWLNINQNSGILSGIPTNSEVGIFWVNVTVNDGNSGTDFTNFTLNVVNTNDRPIIITPNNLTAIEDVYYQVNYQVYEEDIGDSVTWYIDTNASWLYFGTTTGILSGTPSNDDVGWYDVNISCHDDSFIFDYTEFILTVNNTNDFPIITTNDIITVNEDEYYENDYDAVEIDNGDSISWILNTNASWLKISSETGLLNGTPENSDVGTYWVNVTVIDSHNGFDRTNFTLAVININDPPIISTLDVIEASVNKQYCVDYNATDIDSPLSQFTWLLATNATWLSFNSVSGILVGTPAQSDAGWYLVNITVDDGDGGQDWHEFILTVIPVEEPEPYNHPPAIITDYIGTATVSKKYYVDYNATDDNTSIELLVWSLDTNATWLSIDATTGILSGTPSEADVGWYWVNVSVNDGEGGWCYQEFTLVVIKDTIEPPLPPSLSSPKMMPKNGDTDTVFIFSVDYNHPDDEPPDTIQVVIDSDAFDLTYMNGYYEFSTKLSEGNHTYYFTTTLNKFIIITDELETGYIEKAEIIDPDGENGDDDGNDSNMMLYAGLVVIIIIIIILVLIFLLVLRKESKEEPIEETSQQVPSQLPLSQPLPPPQINVPPQILYPTIPTAAEPETIEEFVEE